MNSWDVWWTHMIRVCVVSDMQTLAFGSSLYIRYNTAAHVVLNPNRPIFGDWIKATICRLALPQGQGHHNTTHIIYHIPYHSIPYTGICTPKTKVPKNHKLDL